MSFTENKINFLFFLHTSLIISTLGIDVGVGVQLVRRETLLQEERIAGHR